MSNSGNVLWLEDVPVSIRANVRLLERRGFSVNVVESFEQAVEDMASHSYDIIFVDYSIPLNFKTAIASSIGLGLEFIERLRREDFGVMNAAAQTILCTAQRESIGENRARLEELGVEVVAKASSYTSIVEIAARYRGSNNSFESRR